MCPPHALRLGVGLNGLVAVFLGMAEAICNPIYVLFDRRQHIRKDARASGTCDGEEVWEIVHCQTEIGGRTVLPTLGERRRAPAPDIDPCQCACHSVKASRDYQGIDLMLNTVRPYTARCNCFDGFLTDIDQFDIFPVVGLEVVDIDAKLCVDIDYFQTYNRENVELIDVSEKPIEAITPSGIRAHGIEHQIDALVIATGFDAMTGALTRVDIRGRGTTPLAKRWKDGPSSYLGLAMHDFPNLFTVTGPGSPSVFSNMLPTIEQHVDWIADCLGHAQKNGYKTIEADAEAERVWWAHCQDLGKIGLKTVTDSWYVGANVAGKARVFLPYFGGIPAYFKKCEEVVENGYEGFSLG